MSALSVKIQRLLTDNGGELNGIVNAALFVEILNDIESKLLPGKKYSCLMTQEGTDNPVVQIINNDLDGEIVWTREDNGIFHGTLEGAFENANHILLQKNIVFNSSISGDNFRIYSEPIDDDAIYLEIVNMSAGTGDDQISNVYIEILVIPQ